MLLVVFVEFVFAVLEFSVVYYFLLGVMNLHVIMLALSSDCLP